METAIYTTPFWLLMLHFVSTSVLTFRCLSRTYLTFCTMYASVALAYHQAVDDLHRFRTYQAPVSQKSLPVPDPRSGVFTITVNPLYSLPDPLTSLPVPASRARPQVVEIDLAEESKQPQSCSAVLVSCVKYMFQSFFTQT
ncbi:uncharacterized protein LOC124282090 [Haliotis rubra]|uniref:uncharacterized protein LOC124282090 n=1 Tax=Haliotis rubra TaxID=36100 RepID=UPI001EE5DAF9|nr:uncharacterized protein LOC124282090 [Haliotis rubra]